MKVQALVSFQGDLGPGNPVVAYDAGTVFDAPDRVGAKWIGRGLVKPAPVTKKPKTEASDNGE